MEFPDRMSHKVVSKNDVMFEEICELLELDAEQVDYLVYEDFDEVDYSMYEDFDDGDVGTDNWTPETRVIEVYFLDGTKEEVEIELDSEMDETIKRLLGDL
ncbi:MAG: hypothetical protein KDH97_16475 [Calditrichaeota bacterium]|nr:hypothetical protein [Calditrichota bacterium]MCB9089197.1 hypothetical protein [Calditrichia bacterium]MCB0291852.1 hypothetical protein [Calditrichota bacterium]MCB0295966.1 hypothetical protein [Calditrichota bacterium]MCB0302384.1 hypothetical protein [Calditrichota bacterium]